MKVGIIVQPNRKGQIVIPRPFRKALGIDAAVPLQAILRGGGIYLYPVDEILLKIERESSYARLLQKTQGAWGEEDWNSIRRERRQVELEASRRRRKRWSS